MTTQNYILISLIAIFLILIICIIWLYNKLTKILGKKGHSIDEAIDMIRKDTESLKVHAKNSDEKFEIVNKKLSKVISGTNTVRFNPFAGDGSGSNQSFATAFLNKDGDGVVISSLYSRERVSVFSKPVKNLNSEYELTSEEKSALKNAKDSII